MNIKDEQLDKISRNVNACLDSALSNIETLEPQEVKTPKKRPSTATPKAPRKKKTCRRKLFDDNPRSFLDDEVEEENSKGRPNF